MDSDTGELSLLLDLLDDQIVDSDGLPIGRVDDVEIDLDTKPEPVVVSLLVGAEALGPRIGGLTGTLMRTTAARLRPTPGRAPSDHVSTGPAAVPAVLITQLRPLVRLAVPLASLPQIAGLERWLAAHLIGPLTGGRHEGQ
jgi:sporulation protein YlmC with PRC-barrel domain